jgi:hypothetical protein
MSRRFTFATTAYQNEGLSLEPCSTPGTTVSGIDTAASPTSAHLLPDRQHFVIRNRPGRSGRGAEDPSEWLPLVDCDRRGVIAQRHAELRAPADAELGEHLAQVPLHGARTHE